MFLLVYNKNIHMPETKRNPQVDRIQKLLEVALYQHGYFTAKQAEQIGYLPTNFQHHVKSGAWVREERGLYRIKTVPASSHRYGQMMHYQLWSRNRADKPLGIYSHETALALFELSDVMPAKLHMSVPQSFRKWAKTPAVLKLYFDDIDPADVMNVEGILVTKPLRTILDLIRTGETSAEFIEQAIWEAMERGMVTLKEFRGQESKMPEMKEMLEQALLKNAPKKGVGQ
jgi:predicted transcriptional regulator of viral defense system